MIKQLDLKVASVLARRLSPAARPSPRIAVVGGCQAFGIAYGLRLLAPRAQVDRFVATPGCLTSLEMMARTLREYDCAFVADFPAGFLRGGDSRALIEASGAQGFPTIVFVGYHPDFICLQPSGAAHNLIGPMGAYHSSLAAYGFLAGFTVEQTFALFNQTVFERMGYMQLWSSSAENLIAWGRNDGLELGSDLLRWSRRGCFMHTISHPRGYVLFDLARLLIKKAGLADSGVEFDDFPYDPLAGDVVLPVYEPIAHQLGIKGGWSFRTSRPARDGKCLLNLREFLTESFAAFARAPRGQIANPRLDSMFADEGLQDDMRRVASSVVAGKAIYAASL